MKNTQKPEEHASIKSDFFALINDLNRMYTFRKEKKNVVPKMIF